MFLLQHHFPEEVDQLRQTIAEGMFANENKEWYSGYYEAATKNAVAMVNIDTFIHFMYNK